MTHEAGVERPGVQGRRGCAGTVRGAVRARRVTDVLRRRREELGLSVADVAARLEISTGAYGSWERAPAKEWTDEMLCALVKALEMSDQQGGWLFRLAVDRDPPPPWTTPVGASVPVPPLGPARPSGPAFPAGPVRPYIPVPPSLPASPSDPADPADPTEGSDPETRAYLRDYATMMDAVPLPSVLFDRRWEVAHANPAFDALFRGVGPHPTAMPDQNFLRFVLFHPDAGTVLADRETSWCLPLLARLESALEADAEDRVLQAIRRDIAEDPIMDAAYRCGLPHWMRAAGAAAVHHDGVLRPLHHPDPRWGRTECRIVDETPASLQDRGFTRMTLVLRETRVAEPVLRRGKSHLRAVSSG
ncbi:helix-turn-helix domain-containing protein [Streptomyces sp. NBC_01750]|uniref:helix-turn-helix domain-containing protein n=1 Tax=Streptomyces sp. NBC_01750 TaxID=2975928 RepID=UPI002DDA1CB1|nr:helix-turn-helix domain-containing protein [Streptomyces sp. NBC_01750]WSD36435.1 helix-turn-helix domain-containing protein [Streptomyces sp. NBC_01750]